MSIMKVLLIEDDENECAVYKDIIEKNNNMKLVAMTNSSIEAIKYVNNCRPDGVILDLELNNGEGSGFDFIEKLKEQNIDKYPRIVVITNIYSDSVYNFLHKNKIDFIFYKNQVTYSRENVLNTLLLLKAYETPDKIVDFKLNKDEDDSDKLSELINKELDLIGISTHLKGRKYLYDAIHFIMENDDGSGKISVIQYLVSKYKRSSSTISRAMQNAILHAWRISSLEDLSALYTARINYETGVPTPTEFIYYYSDKIKKCV